VMLLHRLLIRVTVQDTVERPMFRQCRTCLRIRWVVREALVVLTGVRAPLRHSTKTRARLEIMKGAIRKRHNTHCAANDSPISRRLMAFVYASLAAG
jgi:hypothetical protein